MITTPANQFTKDAIRNRMFRNAAKIWGLNDADIDKFDPLVGLLIEACAVEIYKIHNEIHASDNRIWSKLAQLLTPESLTGPSPAHAIMHARSVEHETVLPQLTHFFIQQRTGSAKGHQQMATDVFFSPAGTYKTVDGSINYIASGSNVFFMNTAGTKEFFIKTQGNRLEPHTLWLGVSLHPSVSTLKNLSFYFDWKSVAAKENLYKTLPYSKWWIEKNLLKTVQGINEQSKSEKKDQPTILEEYDLSTMIEKQVTRFYRQRFISIADADFDSKKIQSLKKKYPPEFEACISKNDLQKLTEDLLWIKVVFPADFTGDILDTTSVSINCFPVINRRLNQLRYKLQHHFNIIPLTSRGPFFTVRSLQGSDGQEYIAKPVYNSQALDKGTYLIREGITRFDSESARSYLEYLVELIRDESSAFAALGRDSIASLTKEIGQNIALIEQQLLQENTDLSQASGGACLHINPREEGDTVSIEFWTTDGAAANHISSGSRLESYYTTDLTPESIYLVTSVTGGKDKLTNKDVINTYKSTLLSRGRIVTVEDIKAFCHAELGTKLKEVEVKKGIAPGNLPKEGFKRSLDVYLTPQDQSLSEEAWQALFHNLQLKLEQQSIAFSNYRLMLKRN